MTRPAPNKAPAHLTPRSRRLWDQTLAEYELDPLARETLRLALEALDQADTLRAVIDKDGEIITDRFGIPKRHPAEEAWKTSLNAYRYLCRELNLGGGDPAEMPHLTVIPNRYMTS